MLFPEAVERFRRFLGTQDHFGPLVWIVPSDAEFWFNELLIRPRNEATLHAERLFNEAGERGFGVAIEAIATLDHRICCFIFAPDDAEDAALHFVAPPLTTKVREQLRSAQEPNAIRWWLARKMASKRSRSRILQFFGYDLDRRREIGNI